MRERSTYYLDLLEIGLGPLDKELAEVLAPVCQQRDGMRDIKDDERL